MAEFLNGWFYDWLAVTIPNNVNGKGTKAEGLRGEHEAEEASSRLFTWATLQGLRVMRVGKGTDGYAGGAHLAFDPTASERQATVRAGHKTNMPGLELPGGGGSCASLAGKALADLGPLLIARVDASMDISQAGLWDDLYDMAIELAAERGMEPPEVRGTEDRGRTFYLGHGEASLKVYEKDFERVATGEKSTEDCDPHLVRIEATFRPRKGRKAGLAKIARDEGPGALLGTVYWVRAFAERLAVMTRSVRKEAAQMGLTRVDTTPDPRPIQAKARHGAQQYAKTFCRSAVQEIVETDWGGDWLSALVDPDLVTERALALVREYVEPMAWEVSDRLGVLEVRDHEAEAVRTKILLDDWMDEQRRDTERAQMALMRAAGDARRRCGVEQVAA